jgi:hypothetical protein
VLVAVDEESFEAEVDELVLLEVVLEEVSVEVLEDELVVARLISTS